MNSRQPNLAHDERLRLTGLLFVTGAGWGLTVPLSKIYTSTGHGTFGLMFWQLSIGAVLLTAINCARGKRLPTNRRALGLYLFIAMAGTLVPNWASYEAVRHLPAGVMAIIISTVTIFSFPMALALRLDRFAPIRLVGLILGFGGVALIALPSSSLPDPAMVAWLPLALLAPLCYAFEGNMVAKFGTGGLDGLVVLQGASILGGILVLPVALGTGEWVSPLRPFGTPEWAVVAAAVIHALVYALYVWLVGRTGPVFAAQTSTLVTGFGVIWSVALLGESYSYWVWAAFGLMLISLTLVQPRAAGIAPMDDSIRPV